MSGKSTLQKLAHYYNTRVELNKKTHRRFVKVAVDKGLYFVIDNGMCDKNTLLVATGKHNDFVKVHNGHRTFEQLKSVFGAHSIKERAITRPTKRAVEIFGELYEIE